MLYGHIETMEERVDHMLRARALQDETGGFQAFIPLAFHPDNNQMRKLPAPSASDTLRVHAVARLMLDNIPHVKAFWIATGVEVAQLALWYGADDLDGTVQEEQHLPHGRIADAGGALDGRHPAADPRGGAGAGRARHALQRDWRGRGPEFGVRRFVLRSARVRRSRRQNLTDPGTSDPGPQLVIN